MSDITTSTACPILTDEEKDFIAMFLERITENGMKVVLLQTVATLHPASGNTPKKLVNDTLKALNLDVLGLSLTDCALNSAPAFYQLVEWVRLIDKTVLPERFIPSQELVRRCMAIFWYRDEYGDSTKVKIQIPAKGYTLPEGW